MSDKIEVPDTEAWIGEKFFGCGSDAVVTTDDVRALAARYQAVIEKKDSEFAQYREGTCKTLFDAGVQLGTVYKELQEAKDRIKQLEQEDGHE